MQGNSVFYRVVKRSVIAGILVLGCTTEEVVDRIPGTIVPPITTLPEGKKFIPGQNDWSSHGGFAELTLFESYQKWIDYKRTHGNTYLYYRSFGSWTGISAKYQILVYNDAIARIVRTDFQIDGSTGHVDTLGDREIVPDSANYYRILNVDNMYKYAQDSVLTKNRATTTIYLELFENGLLKECKYRPNNCIDDCLFGVSIDSLVFGEIVDK